MEPLPKAGSEQAPDAPSSSLRWLLIGDVGYDQSYEIDVPLALRAEIEGLFVDLPPRPRERFALVGCTPAGATYDLDGRFVASSASTAAGPPTEPSAFRAFSRTCESGSSGSRSNAGVASRLPSFPSAYATMDRTCGARSACIRSWCPRRADISDGGQVG
nr:hypothetical protein [Micromonospora pallida]